MAGCFDGETFTAPRDLTDLRTADHCVDEKLVCVHGEFRRLFFVCIYKENTVSSLMFSIMRNTIFTSYFRCETLPVVTVPRLKINFAFEVVSSLALRLRSVFSWVWFVCLFFEYKSDVYRLTIGEDWRGIPRQTIRMRVHANKCDLHQTVTHGVHAARTNQMQARAGSHQFPLWNQFRKCENFQKRTRIEFVMATLTTAAPPKASSAVYRPTIMGSSKKSKAKDELLPEVPKVIDNGNGRRYFRGRFLGKVNNFFPLAFTTWRFVCFIYISRQ